MRSSAFYPHTRWHKVVQSFQHYEAAWAGNGTKKELISNKI
jgi:hypothetical protein